MPIKASYKNENAGLQFSVAGKNVQLERPEPLISDIDVFPYKKRMDPQIAIDALLEGNYVLIVDFYSSGLNVLNALKKQLDTKDQTFQGQRGFRSSFRELSHRLLLLVSDHTLNVRKAPEIGWLKILYPELVEFLLPFPQIQGLNSAWQWYEKGISIPILAQKIHPFYGTYFPTRFEHLKLFDHWLKRYKGNKQSAIDIGIGCGVLTFQLLKYNFKKVYGTDSNPNAIIGINETITKTEDESKVELFHGDLFANCKETTELIVFNPPWLLALQAVEGLDKAIYYEADLFPRFFAQAKKHLNSDGRVLLLFSNLGQITKAGESHPIEKELAEGGRFEKELFLQKNVGQASKKTKRNQNWRTSERVELWVLKLAKTK